MSGLATVAFARTALRGTLGWLCLRTDDRCRDREARQEDESAN